MASDLGLVDLHDVLQAAYGWEDRHLHRFTTGTWDDPGASFVCTAELAHGVGWTDEPDPPTWDVRVDELLAHPGERLFYHYDDGDSWVVALEVEEVVDDGVPPGRAAVTDGGGPDVPEDCGGVHGYRLRVAVGDPAHPDHAAAVREFGEMYGTPFDVADLAMTPFDLDVVTSRLAALDLADRRPPPMTVPPAVADLLVTVGHTEAERRLLALAAASDGPVEVDDATKAAMVRPLQLVLDAVGDGLTLTGAGYLPPAVVSDLFEALDMGDDWIGKGNREDVTPPVAELRLAAQRSGLVRKRKGQLLLTARGRQVSGDRDALWHHVAGRLPFGVDGGGDAEGIAGVLLLVLLAAGDTANADRDIAALMTGMGWSTDAGGVDARTAGMLVQAEVRLLQRIGALAHDRDRWGIGNPTQGGIALARAALAET